MEVMGVVDQTQNDVLNIVAGILHLGNIAFAEDGNYAVPEDDGCECPSLACLEAPGHVLFKSLS